jgi:hypothetical protein
LAILKGLPKKKTRSIASLQSITNPQPQLVNRRKYASNFGNPERFAKEKDAKYRVSTAKEKDAKYRVSTINYKTTAVPSESA